MYEFVMTLRDADGAHLLSIGKGGKPRRGWAWSHIPFRATEKAVDRRSREMRRDVVVKTHDTVVAAGGLAAR